MSRESFINEDDHRENIPNPAELENEALMEKGVVGADAMEESSYYGSYMEAPKKFDFYDYYKKQKIQEWTDGRWYSRAFMVVEFPIKLLMSATIPNTEGPSAEYADLYYPIVSLQFLVWGKRVALNWIHITGSFYL